MFHSKAFSRRAQETFFNRTQGLQYLVYDSFTDVDTTALTAHTPERDSVGGGWAHAKILTTAPAVSTQIENNTAEITTSNGGAVIDAGVADCVISCSWNPEAAANDRGRMIFRYASDGNMWIVNLNEVASTITLDDVVANVDTERKSTAFTWVEGQDYSIKIILSGTSIKVYVDDVLKLSHTSAQFQTETQHGIGLQSGNSGFFDTFKITI